uniref:Gem nuclear organelle associated protein 8 n=1 Tax=Saimiri boliviensis boliviensis TaxID=39432 RepID=A0A2K6SS68_SAIBB
MAAMKASMLKATRPWYSHLAYARYCHQNAYKKAVESCFSVPWYFPPVLLPQRSYSIQADSPCSSSYFRGFGQNPHDSSRIQASTREDQALSKEEEMETKSNAETECDLSNMEITEELHQYFAETKRQQQLDAECLESYVNADHDLYCNIPWSVEAPTERPGERRQAEMKHLYGDSAAKIQAMEAAVQVSFDKHCDQKQPKYWPVIPPKF